MSEPEPQPVPLKPGGALLLVFVHLAAFMTVTILMASLTRGDGEGEPTMVGAWNLPIAQAVGLLTALYVGLARYAPGIALPTALRASRPRPVELVACVIALGVGVAVALPAFGVLFRIIAAREGTLEELRAATQPAPMPAAGLAIALIGQLVLVPVATELFFRGFAQGRLEASVGRGRALLVVTVLAALSQLNPYLMPTGLVVALPLGVLAWATGSVWPSVVAHVGVQAAELLYGEAILFATPAGPSWRAIALGAGGAIVGAGLIVAIARRQR